MKITAEQVRLFCAWVRSRATCLEEEEVAELLLHEFDVNAGPEFERQDVQAMWDAWEASAARNATRK